MLIISCVPEYEFHWDICVILVPVALSSILDGNSHFPVMIDHNLDLKNKINASLV